MSFRMEYHVPLKLIFQTYRKLPLIFLVLYIFVRGFRILYEGVITGDYIVKALRNKQISSAYQYTFTVRFAFIGF